MMKRNEIATAPLSIKHLGRYALSVVLSFLDEEEGTSLLITRRDWANKLLPLFQLPNQDESSLVLPVILVNGGPGSRQQRRRRHKFIVVPVQDAAIRLARLNTRRWKQQNIQCLGLSTEEYVVETTTGGTSSSLGYPPLLRFCPSSKSPFRSGTTLLASYPRSGNTLLRSLLESITGIVTGSDTRADRTLSQALADRHDLVGEGLVSPSQTPIVKTHWPERIGFRRFTAQRAILLVRNPFDAIDSYWNLNVTNTHTEKVIDEVYREHATFFAQLALNEIQIWLDFLNFWNSQREHAPILWMRYEDLIQNPQKELLRVMEFATSSNRSTTRDDNNNNNNSSSSSNNATSSWAGRVNEVLQKKGHGYQSLPLGSTPSSSSLDPEETTSRQQTSTASSTGKSSLSPPFAGKSLKRYSIELLHQMHDLDQKSGCWLEKFGYHVFHQNFPHNIAAGNFPPLPLTFLGAKNANGSSHDAAAATTSGGLRINQPTELELRSPHCPFGRNMRNWRRKHTKDDSEPFPTATRS